MTRNGAYPRHVSESLEASASQVQQICIVWVFHKGLVQVCQSIFGLPSAQKHLCKPWDKRVLLTLLQKEL